MKILALASHNPVKALALGAGFRRMFPGEAFSVRSLSVPSGVSDQPTSDQETLQGAIHRAEGAALVLPEADFTIGIEGGIEDREGTGGRQMEAFAWVVVLSAGQRGQSRSASFTLPPQVAELVRSGIELGEADDRVFGRSQSKHKEGAVGLLTGNAIDRAGLYEQAVALALIPFKSPHFQSP